MAKMIDSHDQDGQILAEMERDAQRHRWETDERVEEFLDRPDWPEFLADEQAQFRVQKILINIWAGHAPEWLRKQLDHALREYAEEALR